MEKRGKNINVYLMDGEAGGRIKATISNWTGIAYKIPRSRLSLCKERKDFSQSSVYFLFGYEKEQAVVYIGQAGIRKQGGGILVRLMEHDKNPEKSYWTETVVFTTSNNSLGPTELSFLENRFCKMAIAAGRYAVKNGNDPTPGNITEEKESELDEFAENAELILGVLGYKIFERAEEKASETEKAVRQIQERRKAPESRTASGIPPLPDPERKIGEYVRAAMENLSRSGYVFSEEEIREMCTSQWAVRTFHTNKAFMKRYIPGETDTKGADGKYVRFWAEPYTFGNCQVLLSKEWYQSQRKYFDAWYGTLKERNGNSKRF